MLPTIICFSILFLSIGQSEQQSTNGWQAPGRCGTNCLFVFLTLIDNSPIDYDSLAEQIPVSRQGSSIAELERASTMHGVASGVKQVQLDDLATLRLPFVLHLDLSRHGSVGHFFTVWNHELNDDGSVVLHYFDGGNLEVKSVPAEALKNEFSGFVLVQDEKNLSVWFASVFVGCALLSFFGANLWPLLNSKGKPHQE